MTTRRVVGRKGRNSVSRQKDSWVVELVKAGERGMRLAVTLAASGDVLVAQAASNGEQQHTDPPVEVRGALVLDDASCGGYNTYPVVFACRAK